MDFALAFSSSEISLSDSLSLAPFFFAAGVDLAIGGVTVFSFLAFCSSSSESESLDDASFLFEVSLDATVGWTLSSERENSFQYKALRISLTGSENNLCT